MRLLIAAAAALTLAACNQPVETPATTEAPPVEVNAPSGEYAVDPNHTTVTVRARHFGLAFYTLRFNNVSGMLNFNAEHPAQSTINATVDMTSLDTPYGGNRNFDAELQNSSWLDSASFASATFVSTAAEQTGPNTARVTGDLTIRGQTHPATFDVTYDGSHCHTRWVCKSLRSVSRRARQSSARNTASANCFHPRPAPMMASAIRSRSSSKPSSNARSKIRRCRAPPRVSR